MKNFLLGFLTAAVLAVAVYTRPSELTFREQLAREAPAGVLGPPDQLTYVDRVLWVDVRKDAQTLYSGAFGHWFPRKGVSPSDALVPEAKVAAKKAVGKAIDSGAE